MSKIDIKLANLCNVPALPAGLHDRGAIAQVHIVYLPSGHRGRIFFKDQDGKVFADKPVDVAREHVTNDAERKAFAAMAGVRLKDIKELIRAKNKKVAEENKADALNRTRRAAERQGYRLVKIKNKTPFVPAVKS